MYILGIDPGIQNLGWAIIEIIDKNLDINNQLPSNNSSKIIKPIKSGTIKNSSKLSFIEKLEIISNQLQDIIDLYKLKIVGIETTFMHIGIKANMNFTKLYGALLEIFIKNEIKILEFSPTQIKKTITQNGKASKMQISNMVKFLLPDAEFSNEHESDAFSIAYTAFINII
ncbi:MAG: crossover junction endodeoxyribonuclease RuvC [Rickettsiales bacterium]